MVSSALRSLTDPVGFLWAMLLAAVVVAVFRRWWRGALGAAALAVFLQVFAGTTLPWVLVGRLEEPFHPARHPLPGRADAVVMLGGALAFDPRSRFQINLGEASDRIVTAVDLIRDGRAGVLVLCSAAYELNGERRPDSELILAWLRTWRLPTGEVIRLPIGRNTRDEALYVADLMAERKWERILLVTSASHLRRATAAFQRAGITNAVPVACDFQSPDPAPTQIELLGVPRTEALNVLSRWIHEQVGWWYYGWRDWR